MNADFSPRECDLISAAQTLARDILVPNAQTADRAVEPLRSHFRALGDAGFAGISLPEVWGGSNIGGMAQREIIEALAGGCGVTCFTLMQHHGSSRMIANSSREALKARVLPDLAAGNTYCAVSFAHLRRPGEPVLRATPVAGGFHLNGVAPWASGWGLMNQVVVGATLPDGTHLYGWCPANREEFADLFASLPIPEGGWGELTASAPLPLCAMNASATVELTFTDYFLPEAHFLHTSTRETMANNDKNNVLGPTAAPLGCARAAIETVQTLGEKRNLPAIRETATALEAEYHQLKSVVTETLRQSSGQTANQVPFETALALRGEVILFANRCALSACAAASGAANNLTHPAQRLLREAMFYAVQAQTHDVMTATLKGLAHEKP